MTKRTSRGSPGPLMTLHQHLALSTHDSALAAVPNAVVFEGVSLAFDDNVVLREVSFAVPIGHLTVLIGASGAGKSVVLKLILGLLKPDSGAILVNGERIDSMTEAQLIRVRDDIGMLFQESALFDSLSVADNVGYKLYEETDMPAEQVRVRVEEVLRFVGLAEHVDRMPSELSGGHALMENGQLRIVQAIEHVTEDVRFIMLKDGQIYFQGSAAELLGSQDPYLRTYLSGWIPPLAA